MLAFAPHDLKLDGRFHRLKVEFREKHRGVRLRARRGYFANRENVQQTDFKARLVPVSE